MPHEFHNPIPPPTPVPFGSQTTKNSWLRTLLQAASRGWTNGFSQEKAQSRRVADATAETLKNAFDWSHDSFGSLGNVLNANGYFQSHSVPTVLPVPDMWKVRSGNPRFLSVQPAVNALDALSGNKFIRWAPTVDDAILVLEGPYIPIDNRWIFSMEALAKSTIAGPGAKIKLTLESYLGNGAVSVSPDGVLLDRSWDGLTTSYEEWQAFSGGHLHDNANFVRPVITLETDKDEVIDLDRVLVQRVPEAVSGYLSSTSNTVTRFVYRIMPFNIVSQNRGQNWPLNSSIASPPPVNSNTWTVPYDMDAVCEVTCTTSALGSVETITQLFVNGVGVRRSFCSGRSSVGQWMLPLREGDTVAFRWQHDSASQKALAGNATAPTAYFAIREVPRW